MSTNFSTQVVAALRDRLSFLGQSPEVGHQRSHSARAARIGKCWQGHN